MEDVSEMVSCVGVDAHLRTCAVYAMNRVGEPLRELQVPTTKRELQEAIAGLPRPVWVMVEASTAAYFVKDCLAPVADRVIVCETRENRLVSQSDQQGDPEDAQRLCRLLRMGEFKEVHVPMGVRRDIRELVQAYQKTVGDVVRVKNRIRMRFGRHGVAVEEGGLYAVKHRQEWLGRLRRPNIRHLVETQYEVLDTLTKAQQRLLLRASRLLRPCREYRRIKTAPGVGPVLAAIFIAVIDTPERFANKRKLWAYGGLGVRYSWSANPKKVRKGGTSGGNRLLKYAARTAALHALRGQNRFSRHYAQMLANKIDPAMARKTIARNILTTVWTLWKTDADYRDDPQAKTA